MKDDIIQRLGILYENINSEGHDALLNGREKVDPFLGEMELDRRLGLTLLISIKSTVCGNLEKIEQKIKKIEPGQYFYPGSDLHVTVIDLIAGNENFVRDDRLIDQYITVIQNAVKNVPAFDLMFKGIIAGQAAILAKGYYILGLQQIREQMRSQARIKGISFHERYQSISAHSSFVRFKSEIRNREQLLEVVRKYNDFDIGTLKVNELELVIHDWYNRRKEEVKKFELN